MQNKANNSNFYPLPSMDLYRISKFSLLALILLTVGCDLKTTGNQEKESNLTDNNAPEKKAEMPSSAKFSMKYSSASISKKDKNCTGKNCTRVNVKYPKFEGEAKLDNAIQTKVSEYLAEFVMGAKETDSPESIASLFVASYNDFKKEFPEVTAPWYIDMGVIPAYQSKDFLSFRFETESYGGGAHANTETHLVNFSPKGKVLDKVSYFIRDKQQLTKLAERQFRKNHNLDASESLTAAGFNFDNDKFSLSDNFGFNEKGIIFYYNNYDIAAYSEGASEVVVPFQEFQDIFRIEL